MPIKKSASKHLRQTKKRTVKHNQTKRELKEYIKKTRQAITAGDKAQLQEYAKNLQQVIDKAAQKKVIKPNSAARRKARLMRNINQVLSS